MVLEAGKVHERAIVRLAARRIIAEELARLERIVARREESHPKAESIAPHDVTFHGLIATASRNEVLGLPHLAGGEGPVGHAPLGGQELQGPAAAPPGIIDR